MNDFFDERTNSSTIKSAIVTKYFDAWSNVLLSKNGIIAYVDLYCGPGKYEDGSISTPLKILEMIINHNKRISKVATFFNDANKEYIENLRENVLELEGYENLKYKPRFHSSEVDDSLSQYINKIGIPTLTFIDPFGYKGLSLELIRNLLENKGSECIIFFNFNRISTSFTNSKVENIMIEIFGYERFQQMSNDIKEMDVQKKEHYIINQFSAALEDCGAKYVLPFRFHSSSRDSTSHYIIHATKHVRGYNIMKEIMYTESKDPITEIGTFEYIPIKYSDSQLNFLELFVYDIENLKTKLLKKYSGKSMSVEKIYEDDNLKTPYRLSDYKTALKELEIEEKITTTPNLNNRRKNTMADYVMITFE